MAEHTIVVAGVPSSGRYRHYRTVLPSQSIEGGQDCSFTFNLPDLTGATIKSLYFSASVSNTYRAGTQGDFSCKFSGQTLGEWIDAPYANRSFSGLSIQGSAGKTAEYVCKQTKVNHLYRSGESGYYDYGSGADLSNPRLTIVFDGELTETTISPLSGSSISSSQDTVFSWNLASYSEVVSQSLFWKKSTDVNYTEISLAVDQTSYTFPGGTFDNGTIQWYVSAEDVDGNVVDSGVETVDVGIVPSVEIAYPIGVNIKSSNIQIFTWEMHEDVPTGQYSYEIQYKESEDADWTVVTGTSSNQYHSFAADTFSAGEYQLKVTNNDGLSSEYVNSTFTAIGATDAPVITSVTNSSIPTITWTVTSQDTFEVEIYKGQERIYTSGVQVGYDVRSFTPNIMLDDGNYIIKMRAMNQYGYFTPWLDYSFVLDPEHPDALTCYAYANDHHGVTIARSLELDPVTPDTPGEPSDVPDAHYVIRRVHGETTWKIIGKLDILDESVKFEDNTVLPNVAYDYAIRNYASGAGFTDSNVVTITISFQEYILSSMTDGNKFVLFYRTEDQQFDMSHGSSKNQSYSYMIGRKYPVRESSEWLAHNDSFSCFVSFEEYERLLEFYSGNDDLWFRGKNFTYQCSIDELSIKDALLGDGYTLGISVSRTDEEELRLF